MEKQGLNINFIGKIYNPRALSKGCSFAIMLSKKDQNEEWHSVFIDVYTPINLPLESKDKVKLTGFAVVEEPFKDRPAKMKIIAMDIKVLEKGTGQVVNHVNTPAATVTASTGGAQAEYGF